METPGIVFVLNYWDVPVEGIAVIEGSPCYFEAEFNADADEYSDIYHVAAVSDATRRAAARAQKATRLARDRSATTSAAPVNEVAELLSLLQRDLSTATRSRMIAKFVRVSRGDVSADAFTATWSPLR